MPLLARSAEGIEKLRFQHRGAKNVVSEAISAYEEARQFDKAEAWRRKWLAAVEAEPASPEYAAGLASLGLLLLKQRKGAEAEPVLRECLAICEKVRPEAWPKFNTRSLLGGELLVRAKHAEAEPRLLGGYAGLEAREKTIPPSSGTRIPAALDRLIALYTAAGEPDEVEKWRAEPTKHPEAKSEGQK